MTYTRDITQAYIKSRAKLEVPVYIHVPQELILPVGTFLKLVTYLCGIPESGLHWYFHTFTIKWSPWVSWSPGVIRTDYSNKMKMVH